MGDSIAFSVREKQKGQFLLKEQGWINLLVLVKHWIEREEEETR